MIVGLLGFIGSGKGSAGEILKNHGFIQTSFASSVKDVVSVMFGWDRALLEGDTEDSRNFRENVDAFWSDRLERPFTPRLALQLMGTEVGRDIFHKDFWIHVLDKKVQDPNKNYVITDVRFMNEVEWIHSKAGTLIEIRRGVTPHWYDIAGQANRGSHKAEDFMLNRSGVHESEWRWVGCNPDHIIDNDGTLDALGNKLFKCLKASYGNVIIDEILQGENSL